MPKRRGQSHASESPMPGESTEAQTAQPTENSGADDGRT
jgi:hypothetical protein